MVRSSPDGKSRSQDALQSSDDAGGGVTGKEERRLGVPLIPDRAAARSHSSRWTSGVSDAVSAPRQVLGRQLFVHRLVRGVAAVSVTTLAVSVVVGSTPMPAAITVALLVPAAVFDIDQRRLPDIWIGAASFALVSTLVISWSVGRSSDPFSMVTGLVGGSVAMALPVLVLHLMSPTAMGFGDVKAAVVLGAAVGTIDWRLGAVALCIAALTGAAAGLLLRQRTIAFGPCLVLGAWITLLAHGLIVDSVFTGGGAP